MCPRKLFEAAVVLHAMRRAFVSLSLLLVSLSAFADPTCIARAAGAITIDGNLDDAGWQNAAKFETWYETNPGDNIEPKVKQIGYATYDDHFFYVAIDMWDVHPANIRSA